MQRMLPWSLLCYSVIVFCVGAANCSKMLWMKQDSIQATVLLTLTSLRVTGEKLFLYLKLYNKGIMKEIHNESKGNGTEFYGRK